MVFDIEKAIEDRIKAKENKNRKRELVAKSSEEKDGEKTYGIYFVTENGESFPDYKEGDTPEQAFSSALQRIETLKGKINLEKCLIKNYETGELFDHKGRKIE